MATSPTYAERVAQAQREADQALAEISNPVRQPKLDPDLENLDISTVRDWNSDNAPAQDPSKPDRFRELAEKYAAQEPEREPEKDHDIDR